MPKWKFYGLLFLISVLPSAMAVLSLVFQVGAMPTTREGWIAFILYFYVMSMLLVLFFRFMMKHAHRIWELPALLKSAGAEMKKPVATAAPIAPKKPAPRDPTVGRNVDKIMDAVKE